MPESKAAPAPEDALSALLAEIVQASSAGPSPWDRVLAPGARVGRFELVRELGRGGFGIVFEALDRELHRRVAFKAIRPGERARDPASAELLRREAMAVAQLQHPGIVTLFDAGHGAGPYLIFELLRGETLAARLRRGRLSAREAMRIALAVSRALAHAHAHGVLHRDLKPSNVFLCADGGVKVLDFGLAHVFDAGGPAGSGTPGYMAPEQRRGGPEDARTDVYAVGVLLAEMVGARSPGGGDPVDLLAGARVPAPLAELARRCASPDPVDRPPDAPALERELARLLDALDRTPGRPAPAPAGPGAVEALRHFFRGEECQARPVFGQDCAEHYRRAVELDPGLAAAHYQLAVWTRRFGGMVADQRTAIERALAHCDRAPPLEQVLIRAFAAHLGGRDADAMALFREAIDRWPGDARAHYELGDLLRHQDELALAIPCFERAVALHPDHGWALGQLAEALGALGRTEALRGFAAGWERAESPIALHALALARGWLGDAEGAAAAARRGLALGAGLVAQQDLLGALVFLGRYGEVEEGAAVFRTPGSPVRRVGFYALAALEAYRGRRRAGLAHLDALEAALPEVAHDALYHAIRADYLLGDGDPAAVRAATERILEIDPRVAAEHAPGLAWLGDLEGAAALARGLPPGCVLARMHDALAAWHRGERDRALAILAAVCADTPISAWRVAPLFVYGDLCARAGRDEEAARALAAADRLYVPRMMWRSWARPRGLVLLARVRARSGDAAGARAALEPFFAEWAGADPDEPLLAEASEIAARLGER